MPKRPKSKNKLKQLKFLSKEQIVIVIVLFSLLGGYFIWQSFAASNKPFRYSLTTCERKADQSFVMDDCSKDSAESLVYRFYRLILGRTPEIGGYEFWTHELVGKQSQTLDRVALRIMASKEGKNSRIGKMSDTEFIKYLHVTAYGTNISSANLKKYQTELKTKRTTRAKLATRFATSDVAGKYFQTKFISYLKSIGEVYEFKNIGKLANPNRPGFIRDGGEGAKVGSKYLWTFGDTLFNPKSVDGVNGRSNTAGLASLDKPLAVSEPLDANRAPQQFIELSASDKAYNLRTNKGDDRYAIWINSVLPRPKTKDALVFYLRLKVNPGGSGLNYDLLNSGVAVVKENSTKASIVKSSLFAKPNLFNGSGYVEGDYYYMYQCKANIYSLKNCRIGRVKVAEATDASKYTFWDGLGWQSDLAKAKYDLPGHSSGTSLGKLPTGKYAIFYSKPFTNEVYMMTSTKLTSDWSDPQKIYTASNKIYAVNYHPDLTKHSVHHSEIFLSFYEQKTGLQVLTSKVRPLKTF